jgi:hypothetical protein
MHFCQFYYFAIEDIAGNSATCYDVHFDRSGCQAFEWRKSNNVSNVKKINHDLPLCQNNVNGVYTRLCVWTKIFCCDKNEALSKKLRRYKKKLND